MDYATAEQLKSLIRSYFTDDLERFTTGALQVAAHEVQQGHGALAHEVREIVDKARSERDHGKVLKFPQDLRGLVPSEEPSATNSSMALPDALKPGSTESFTNTGNSRN